MKLVSTEYDPDLKDWDMNRIKQVKENYDKVSRGIQRRKQKLLGNIPGSSVLPSQPVPGQGVYPSQDAPTAPAATSFNGIRNPHPMQQAPLRRSHMQQAPLQQGQS